MPLGGYLILPSTALPDLLCTHERKLGHFVLGEKEEGEVAFECRDVVDKEPNVARIAFFAMRGSGWALDFVPTVFIRSLVHCLL